MDLIAVLPGGLVQGGKGNIARGNLVSAADSDYPVHLCFLNSPADAEGKDGNIGLLIRQALCHLDSLTACVHPHTNWY